MAPLFTPSQKDLNSTNVFESNCLKRLACTIIGGRRQWHGRDRFGCGTGPEDSRMEEKNMFVGSIPSLMQMSRLFTPGFEFRITLCFRKSSPLGLS